MNSQTEITSPRPLLDRSGRITEEGWARYPHWTYDRKSVSAPWFRIKEWDYYYILSEDLKRGITMTVSDLGYAGLMALCWLDFENSTAVQVDTIALLPGGKITAGESGIPMTPDSGITAFEDSKLSLRFDVRDGVRKLTFSAPGLETARGERGLEGEIVLGQEPDLESMNIATSWEENRKRFYYNRKINCMPASGTVRLGGQEYVFRSDRDSGTIDWGRGAWPYRNRWYWGSASGYLKGEPFGFNLGYGFSDRTPASENMLFYRGKAHKLEEISFHFNPSDYMKPWRVSSSDGRLELDFQPLLDRSSEVNLMLIRSAQHQVFGRFSGRVVLDDGTELMLDNFLGFAEDVLNNW